MVKFLFGDIVVVENDLIGVIVKSWENKTGYTHEVYVRNWNQIKDYKESQIERYGVRHKELNDEDLEYQSNYLAHLKQEGEV